MRGTEQSGTFYSAVKGENKKLAALIAGFFVSSIVLCTIGLLPLNTANQPPVLKAVLLCFVIAAAACFFFRRMNALLRGNPAHYSCDDVKFTVTSADASTTLYFTAIEDITFAERKFLKLKRGYDVTVFTSERSYRFTIVFNGFNNLPRPEDTPFNPIVTWVRCADKRLSSSLSQQEFVRPAPDMSAPCAPLLRSAPTPSTDEMPTVGGSSLQGVLSRLDEELNAAADAAAQPVPPAPPVQPVPSPEQERIAAEENPVITLGTFSCEHPSTWVLRIFAAASSVVGGLFVLRGLAMIGSVSKMDYAVGALALIIWVVVWITLFRFGNTGTEYSFRLRRTEMTITRRGGREEVLYTRDLVRVEHRPMRFLWRQYGWVITVVTRYKKLSFRVLFPYGKKFCPYNKTALAQLEEYCPAQPAEKENK